MFECESNQTDSKRSHSHLNTEQLSVISIKVYSVLVYFYTNNCGQANQTMEMNKKLHFNEQSGA